MVWYRFNETFQNHPIRNGNNYKPSIWASYNFSIAKVHFAFWGSFQHCGHILKLYIYIYIVLGSITILYIWTSVSFSLSFLVIQNVDWKCKFVMKQRPCKLWFGGCSQLFLCYQCLLQNYATLFRTNVNSTNCA